MFTPEQIAELEAPLNRDKVKTRKQGSAEVSYIEGYHAENEANRIFGFDAWSRETIDLKCVAERPRKIGKGQYEKDGFGVSYIARVRITVRAGDREVVREGVGAGHGIDADPGQAHESAVKEAETDAEKRALKTFGNPFGQALYDKEQRDVADALPPAVEKMLTEIRACETVEQLNEWQKTKGKAANETGHGPLLVGEWTTRKQGLTQVANLRAG
jgi:DNA recombination protein Rad52